jgi:hypothetical protein
MKKSIHMLAACCVVLAGCGGGGGSGGDAPAPAAKSLKVSLYGNPLVSSSTSAKAQATSFAQAASAPDPASAPTSAGDVSATVQTLTDALTSRGVPATVTPQVMDGTTLHQIVIGENNGLPPTPDQFKTDPSEWLILNFALDDMVTSANNPNQLAAVSQFAQDLSVFTQRAAVSGKRVFVVVAIPTCDVPNQNSAADGLNQGILKAGQTSNLTPVGTLPFQGALDANGNIVNQTVLGHMGADCRIPDAFILNQRTQIVADDIASRYKAATSGSPF